MQRRKIYLNETFLVLILFPPTFFLSTALFSSLVLPGLQLLGAWSCGEEQRPLKFRKIDWIIRDSCKLFSYKLCRCFNFKSFKPKPKMLFWFRKAVMVLNMKWVCTGLGLSPVIVQIHNMCRGGHWSCPCGINFTLECTSLDSSKSYLHIFSPLRLFKSVPKCRNDDLNVA